MSNARSGSASKALDVIETVESMRDWKARKVREKSADGRIATLGLVPTMGYLHAGHLSLVEKARRECDLVAVSIFVNPLQFGPSEDFERYPRDLDRDLSLLQEAHADCVFHPSREEVYGKSKGVNETTTVVPPNELIDRLCGTFRPGHFEGVATVVTKLLNIVAPDYAYFGEKDYQQLLVVKQLVNDLNLNIKICGVPIVREQDGLAMSSRNVYLSESGRKTAPLIHEVLDEVKETAERTGETKAALKQGKEKLAKAGFEVQYLEACRADNLLPIEKTEKPMVILCAAKLDNVRLIDNLIVR